MDVDMEEGAQNNSELTAFAPFEIDKASTLPFKGNSKPTEQVEIRDGGFPKVLFRKLQIPTPAVFGEVQRSSNPAPVRAVRSTQERDREKSRVHARPDSFTGMSVSNQPTPSASTAQQPRAQVTKSLVLNRIGNLENNQDPTDDLKKYWMPDSACKECFECQTKFNLIVRRHHCRICGRIFCNTCCSQTIPGVLLRPDLQGNLRVCNQCLDIFQEFQTSKGKSESAGQTDSSQNSEIQHPPRSIATTPPKSQLELPLNVPPESPLARGGSGTYSRSTRPMSILSPHKSWDDTTSIRSQEVEMSPSRMNFEFDNPTPLRSLSSTASRRQSGLRPVTSETEERLLALGEDEVEFTIHEVWFNMMDSVTGLQLQNHRYRLRAYPNTFTAHSIVEWLVTHGHSRSREVAVRVGQALVDTKRLKIVSSIDQEFKDESNIFLELGEAASLQPDPASPTVTDAPKWFQHLREDADSEYEVSAGVDNNTMRATRYAHPSRSFMSDTTSAFLESRSFQDPTIIISSVSELTGGSSGSSKDTKSPVELSESEEEYLVIKEDNKGEENKGSSHDIPGESSPQSSSQTGNGHEISIPAQPTISPRYTLPGSFSIIDNQEVLKALPVTGLSSASEAAKELNTESGNVVKSNEEARAAFERDHDNHFDILMIQLMQSFGLSLNWLSIIKPLITEASRKVKTNVFVQDLMDINSYVKVKKIPGGQKRNSSLVFGVVCSKNVTHKKMNLSIQNPTILLLKCAFEFQRKENQLSSFDTLQLQEEKYLKNLVSRVETFKPSIILVQKSVSRLALEMFYELGVAVVVNVKPSVMGRVARSTGGDLLHSLDQLFFDVHLGTCGHFYIRTFTLPDGAKKTLMYFDHCEPMLGCVITLQGGTKRELKKVKKVTCFGLYICRNSYLETSFLVDEFAWPPSFQPKLLQNTDDYSSTPSTPEWPLYPSLACPPDSISPSKLAKKLAILAPASDQLAPPGLDDPLTEQCPEPLNGKLDISSRKGNLEPNIEEESQETSKLHLPEVSAVVETQEAHSPVKEMGASPVNPAMPAVSSEVLSHLGEKEFQLALENQLLSVSPNVLFPTPYLQMAQGMAADVRQYLPKVVYWSYQFQTKTPDSSQTDGVTSPMEMGLSKTTVQKSHELKSFSNHHLNERVFTQPSFKHSYKSVSDHPLTTSIFLLKANTNEMKAALADYRARAGLSEEADCFFFPAARRASDYRLHLQNVFNKYKQFEMAASAVDSESTDAKSVENEVKEAPLEEKSEGTPLKRRTKRWKAPEKSCSSSSDLSDHSEELYQPSRSPLERSTEKPKDIVTKSTSENFGSSLEVPKKFERRSLEPIAEGFTDEFQKVSKMTRSVSSKFSEKFGTFEDLDHNRSQEMGGEEEEGNVDIGMGVTEEWAYDGWMAQYQQADCLSPLHHQGISILFSSTCHDGQKHQLPCVPPCIIPMNYYGRNDISLGEFLYRYCFRPFYRCQTCGVEMNKHQRHVVHGDSGLHIIMQQLDAVFPGNSEKIYTWLACRHCAQCTPYVQMSEESLLFSFAKFLELRFYGSSYQTRYHSDGTSNCPHFMHRDYVQYFCCKNSIAAFQPSPISLMEVRIPPRAVSISTPHSEYHHDYGSEIKHVQRIIEGVFYRIRQKLQQYHMEPVTATIKDYAAGAKAERDTFRNKLKLLKELVVKEGFIETVITVETSQPMGDQASEDSLDSLQDGIADLKRKLTEVVDCWNINLENLDAVVRAYRSKRDLSVTDGPSPHDSPNTTPTTPEGEGTSSNSETPIPSSFTVTPIQTPSLSPDSSHSTSQHTSGGYSDNSHSTSQVHTRQQTSHLAKPRSHSRNHSDSMIQTATESATKSDGLKSPTQHKRQLSDSSCPKSSSSVGDLSELGRTKQEEERLKKKPETGHGTSEGPPPEGNGSSGAQDYLDNPSNSSLGQDEGGRDKAEYQRIKTMFSYYNQPARGDPSGRRSPHSQSAAQGDDSSHTDSSGGIFAKLRGKDADAREDPNKYYLLDPSELTNSPHLGAPNTLEPPNARPYRRPGGSPRKTAAHTAPSTTEAFGDGRSGERRVVKERSGLLARPFQRLPPPFDMNEHHNMHWHVSIPVAIYEKEATSIIAYALSSHKYAQEIKAMRERKQNISTPLEPPPASPKPSRKQMNEPEKPQVSTSGSKSSTLKAALQELRRKGSAISLFSGLSVSTMSDPPDPSQLDKSSEDPKRLEGTKTRDASQMGTSEDDQAGPDPATSVGSRHISLEFTTPDKSASFFCKVYFAEEFYQLRKLIFPSGEVRFVRSLSRCVKYDAKGGKSRSTFCKVADDRFILKQIKSVEISSFEQFAPQYFEHVTTAMEEKRPLMLAKILGAYSIGYRNTKTGNSKRLDVIVMENLLYGHKSTKVFDLKGSMRSRYVDPSKESSGDVLLDENYLNYICNCPVYVYPHSKCVLMQAILADTEFLAKNSIMDYSLLTCIDEASGELVVGIIDYVRPFTLDKRLEMYLKKTAGRVLPTVVYPELYRKRFCDAMERYFTVVPDKWTGFGPN